MIGHSKVNGFVKLFLVVLSFVCILGTRQASAQQRCDTCVASDDCQASCYYCIAGENEDGTCPNQVGYSTCGESTNGQCACYSNWQTVSRTKIGGDATNTYCINNQCWCTITSYYIDDQVDIAGCAPERGSCDTDHVDFFGGEWMGDNDLTCCRPGANLSNSDYCGGSTC